MIIDDDNDEFMRKEDGRGGDNFNTNSDAEIPIYPEKGFLLEKCEELTK